MQDRRFSDEIDKLTGYKTKSLLCMPIRNSDGEIIGVAQAINKSSSGELFTEDDEKVITLTWFDEDVAFCQAVLLRFVVHLAPSSTFAMATGSEEIHVLSFNVVRFNSSLP